MTTCITRGDQTILLATARAYAIGDFLQQRLARILCDPGSQVSFISDLLANQLYLRRSKCEVAVEGIGAIAHTRTRGSVSLRLKSTHNEFWLDINAFVIPSITSITPAVHVDVTQWQHLMDLQLADPNFGTPGGVDVLIGSDVWGLVVRGHIISGKQDEPHAQQTQFGWVIFGPASTSPGSAPAIRTFRAQVSEDEPSLEELVRNFWKLEEVPKDEIEMTNVNGSSQRPTLEPEMVDTSFAYHFPVTHSSLATRFGVHCDSFTPLNVDWLKTLN